MERLAKVQRQLSSPWIGTFKNSVLLFFSESDVYVIEKTPDKTKSKLNWEYFYINQTLYWCSQVQILTKTNLLMLCQNVCV